MSNEQILQAGTTHVTSHGESDHGHAGHHHETFITKYIFSQDHKMIAKQFLITGMSWAVLGSLQR